MPSLPPPRRKETTQYKRPGRINTVSVTLLFLLVASAYAVYSTWPVITLRLRVKGELEEVMNDYWRANLRGAGVAQKETYRLRKELIARCIAAGVKDKKLDIVFEGNKQRISIEARYIAPVTFPGVDKTYLFSFAPRAETGAERVDW
jgi:hypothetical protein